MDINELYQRLCEIEFRSSGGNRYNLLSYANKQEEVRNIVMSWAADQDMRTQNKISEQEVEIAKFVIADTPQMAISEFNKTMKEEPCYTIISVYFLLDTLPAKEKVDNDVIVCHTNLKENAELVAKILDADACGEIFIEKIQDEIKNTLYVDSLIFTELMDFKAGKISADDVIDEFNRVTKTEILHIFNEYKTGGIK